MIFLECYADEAMVKAFGVTSRNVKHAFSKGEVCNLLRKSTKSIGIVDEDPFSGKPSYEKLMLNSKIFENDRVIFCYEKSSKNKLIIIRPKLEDFIIRLANDNGVDLISYRLSNKPKTLHEELAFKRNYQKLSSLKEVFDLLLASEKLIKEIKNFILQK